MHFKKDVPDTNQSSKLFPRFRFFTCSFFFCSIFFFGGRGTNIKRGLLICVTKFVLWLWICTIAKAFCGWPVWIQLMHLLGVQSDRSIERYIIFGDQNFLGILIIIHADICNSNRIYLYGKCLPISFSKALRVPFSFS